MWEVIVLKNAHILIKGNVIKTHILLVIVVWNDIILFDHICIPLAIGNSAESGDNFDLILALPCEDQYAFKHHHYCQLNIFVAV